MWLTTEDKRSIHRVTLSSFWPIYASANIVYFSISHTCDHVYMLITEDHPPDIECAVMAVFLLVFMLAQSIMVTFTAVNSFYMVVMEKRFDLGRYDWRLLLMAFGLPLVVMAILAGLGMLGPTGGWWAYHCFIYSLKISISQKTHTPGVNKFCDNANCVRVCENGNDFFVLGKGLGYHGSNKHLGNI